MSDDLLSNARRGVHFFLRLLGASPEMRNARRIRSRIVDNSEDVKSGKHYLVASIRDWAIHTHFEACLGLALRNRGNRVSFVSCGGGLTICDRVNTWEGPPMPCFTCSKYVENSFSAYGLDRNVLIQGAFSEESFWIELDELNLEELQKVEWMGFPLAKIVDIPVKWFLLIEDLDEDPLSAVTLRNFLRSGRRILEAALKLFRESRPDVVVVLNGLFVFEAILIEICKKEGIDYVTYERGYILNSFIFASNAIAPEARIDSEWASNSDKPLSHTEEIRLDKYLLDRRSGLHASDNLWPNPQPFEGKVQDYSVRAALFTNLVWDSAVLGQDLAFSSIMSWICETVEFFKVRPECCLIIRIHPAEVQLKGRETRQTVEERIREIYPDLPSNIRLIPSLDPTSSYAIMDRADIGLVYSSTTGLEMALAGLPVIVTARTHYRDKGFTIDVNNPVEYLSELQKLVIDPSHFKVDVQRARKYSHMFFFEVPFVNLGITEPLRGLVEVATDMSEKIQGDDWSALCQSLETLDFTTAGRRN